MHTLNSAQHAEVIVLDWHLQRDARHPQYQTAHIISFDPQTQYVKLRHRIKIPEFAWVRAYIGKRPCGRLFFSSTSIRASPHADLLPQHPGGALAKLPRADGTHWLRCRCFGFPGAAYPPPRVARRGSMVRPKNWVTKARKKLFQPPKKAQASEFPLFGSNRARIVARPKRTPQTNQDLKKCAAADVALHRILRKTNKPLKKQWAPQRQKDAPKQTTKCRAHKTCAAPKNASTSLPRALWFKASKHSQTRETNAGALETAKEKLEQPHKNDAS